MLRTELADRLRGDEVADGFVAPDYGGHCVAGVPGTVADVFGVDGPRTLPGDVLAGVGTDVENVCLLFVDAYGLEQFRETCPDHGFFAGLVDRGRVTPLTSVYPSETAACVPTLHTGRYPAEHGQLGWNGYLDGEDAVFETLGFATKAGDPVPEDAPERFSATPIYPDLAAAGVESHVVEPFDSTDDPKTAGATTHSYGTIAEFALTVRRRLEAADEPRYVYGYTNVVDAASHFEGTRSERHDAELASLSAALSRELCDRIDPSVAAETLLLVVADHGQVDTDPEARVDLLELDVVDEHLRRDRGGVPVVTGGPRNVHLHLDGGREAVRDRLEAELDGLVLDREAALAMDLWGPVEPGAAVREQVGDLLVIPRDGLVWHGGEPSELELVGMHGGMHPREMLVPFGAVRLDELAD